jgi:hypothetical protein
MATFDVLLPVRNAVAYLAEAIESVRGQSFSDWRLLVLDHGSTDGSLELAYGFAERDPRIEVHILPAADGLAGLLNAGLALCDCRFAMRQDADDVSFCDRMARVKEAFDATPSLLLVGGQAEMIDRSGRSVGWLRVPERPQAVAAASFFYNPVLHPTVSMNFDALNGIGGAYGRDILCAVPQEHSIAVSGLAEDYVLFGQMALLGPCANLLAPLVKYRIHDGSVSVANATAQIELSLRVSRFLAHSFAVRTGDEPFDPSPFCNHADYVFDFDDGDYTDQYRRMATALGRGLGPSRDLDRELAFRWVLATRSNARMIHRYVEFEVRHGATASERRTVRNWLLRACRRGKYVYRAPREAADAVQ